MTAKIAYSYDYNFIGYNLIVKRSIVKKNVPDSNERIRIDFLFIKSILVLH